MPQTSLKARALALFDDYIELPGEQRSQALDELRQRDPALHGALARMLAADAGPAPFDTSPLELLALSDFADTDDDRPDDRVGMRLGAWQLDAVIGMGGMGTVYEAHRADGQYQQIAALKCLRAELASPRLLEAFRNERSTLAQLDHPNIAKLLDGGIDKNGHPWFVMQKVDGEPIDSWCDRHGLPLRERVLLLLQACAAVTYAHSRGVLHQDIKPSNLLVTAEGRPMLLDFGLAQLLQPDESAPNRPRIAVSDGYSAPEILHETQPGVATDVYAMGVVLYRLLCADWPVPVLSPSILPARKGLPTIDPRPPSTLSLRAPMHVARERGVANVAALARELHGDLDSIALHCVALDPHARYVSIEALREDLQRWLQRRPVLARNGGVGYRMGRFLRRNALASSLSAIALAGMGTTAAVAIWQIQHSRQESAMAHALAHVFERIPGGAILPEWGSMPLNTSEALDRSERGLRESSLARDPAALSRGLSSIAQGYFAIGKSARGFMLLEEARKLASHDPVGQARVEQAWARGLNSQAKFVQAEQAARAGIETLGLPLTDGAKGILASLYSEISRARWLQGDRKTSMDLLGNTLETIEKSPDDYPLGLRAELYVLRSDWFNQLHRFDESKLDAERALRLSNGTPALEAAVQEQLSALLGNSGHASEALPPAEAALEEVGRRYGQSHPQTGMAWISLAEAQQAAGQPRKALGSSQQALRILSPVLGPAHPEIARALRVGALAQTFLGENDAAVADARRALGIVEAAYGSRHEQGIRMRQALALSLGYASETGQQRQHLLDEALAQYVRLLRDGEILGLPMSREWLAYGIRLGNSNRIAGARKAFERALPQLQLEYGKNSDYAFEAQRSLATLLLKEQRYSEARPALENFADSLRQSSKQNLYRSTALSDTLLDLAHLDLLEDKPEQAQKHLDEALQLNLRQFGTGDPQVVAITNALTSLRQQAKNSPRLD